MNNRHAELLGQAIAGLRLQDIVLFTSSFTRPNPMPEASELEVTIKTRRHVQFVRGNLPRQGDQIQILQVLVDLGLRVVGGPEDKEVIYVECEAVFLAEYEVHGELSEDAIKVFSELNSVHNVWPFWRQHVFDTVHRARLPHITVPLFSGTPNRVAPEITETDAKTT